MGKSVNKKQIENKILFMIIYIQQNLKHLLDTTHLLSVREYVIATK